MEAELPLQWRIAYNMSILSPMKLKFDMVSDMPQPNKCTKFQLFLFKTEEKLHISLLPWWPFLRKYIFSEQFWYSVVDI